MHTAGESPQTRVPQVCFGNEIRGVGVNVNVRVFFKGRRKAFHLLAQVYHTRVQQMVG